MKIKDIRRKMSIRLLKRSILKKMMLFIALVFLSVTSSFSQNCPIIDSASITNVSCYNGNDGVIALVFPLGSNPTD